MLASLLALLRRTPAAPSHPPPPYTGHAMVYLRQGRLYFEPLHRTVWETAGYGIAAEPVTSLEASAAPEALGRALRETLGHCRVEVPVPPEGTNLTAPLQRAMKVRSYRATLMGTRACSVYRLPEGLRVMALHNGGTRGDGKGYRTLEGTEVLLAPDAPDERVGRALLGALEQATLDASVQARHP